MKKIVLGAAALVAIAAAGGAVAWQAASGRLLAALDAELKGLAAAGLTASVADPKVSGFPFAFVVETGEATVAAASGAWRYVAPSTRSTVSLFDWDALRIELPPESRLQAAAPGAPPLDFAVTGVEIAVETALAPGGGATLTARSLSLTHAAEAGLRRAEFGFAAPKAVVTPGPDGRLDARLDAETATLAYDIDDPAGGRNASESTFSGFALALSGPTLAATDFPAFVASGGAAEATVAAASVTSKGSTAGAPEGDIAFTGRSGPSEGRLTVRDGRIAYAVKGAESAYDVDWSALGGGRGAVSAGAAAVSFEMPIRPSETPEPYALRLALEGLTADEPVWAAVDPGKALPREPISFSADIGGQARMLVEIGRAAETAGPPVDVRTVEIADMSFKGLGASAAATGALRLTPGAPAPDGAIALRIEGWRPLLDRLEGIGLVTPDQAAFVEVLAETYAKPGEAEGAIVSEIELKDGAVFANGRRVR